MLVAVLADALVDEVAVGVAAGLVSIRTVAVVVEFGWLCLMPLLLLTGAGPPPAAQGEASCPSSSSYWSSCSVESGYAAGAEAGVGVGVDAGG